MSHCTQRKTALFILICSFGTTLLFAQEREITLKLIDRDNSNGIKGAKVSIMESSKLIELDGVTGSDGTIPIPIFGKNRKKIRLEIKIPGKNHIETIYIQLRVDINHIYLVKIKRYDGNRIKGYVYNRETNKELDSAFVYFWDPGSNRKHVFTDDTGYFIFETNQKVGKPLSIRVEKSGFQYQEKKVTVPDYEASSKFYLDPQKHSIKPTNPNGEKIYLPFKKRAFIAGKSSLVLASTAYYVFSNKAYNNLELTRKEKYANQVQTFDTIAFGLAVIGGILVGSSLLLDSKKNKRVIIRPGFPSFKKEDSLPSGALFQVQVNFN